MLLMELKFVVLAMPHVVRFLVKAVPSVAPKKGRSPIIPSTTTALATDYHTTAARTFRGDTGGQGKAMAYYKTHR